MILIKQHEVKDSEGQQILDAIADRFGYSGNGTKQEFYQKWLLKTTLKEVGNQLVETAGILARISKQSEIDSSIKGELEVKK